MECGNKMSQRGQDQDALLRMGGRLRRSTLPPEPNIQSSYHTITRQDRTRQGTDKILDHQRQKRGEEDNLFIAADRVIESPLFSYTGMDFAGPLFVRPEVQGRNT
ncbi:Outer capsid protein [Trichinella pseudospiralis]